MVQRRGANAPLGAGFTFPRRACARAVALAVAAMLGGPLSGSAAAAAPTPTDLRAIGGVESLTLRWRVSSTEGVRGFRVRWRPASGDSQSWSRPVERPAFARGYKIAGLAPKPYVVRVRAVLAGGALGGAVRAIGTPLPGKSGEEQEEKREEEKREEEPRPEGAVVNSAPTGPPTPASGWHVVYADAFGAPIGSGTGRDHTVETGEKWHGCCNNPEETVAVEQHDQARVGPEGLELLCSRGHFTVEGVSREYSCGGIKTDSSFEFNFATAGEWAAEIDAKWPADTGSADPGFWAWTSAQEIDFFEGWGFAGTSWASSRAGMPVITAPVHVDHCLCNVTETLGFDPSRAYHRYTTLYRPGVFIEYIDGVERWRVSAIAANTSDGLIATNAMRVAEHGGAPSPNVYGVRSVAVYQDGAAAGLGIKGGGVAPGTTLAR